MSNLNCNTFSNYVFIPQNHTILIIEDSKSVNKILYKTFSNMGYKCFSAYSLQEAKVLIEQNDINYIMLDINLPDGNGYDLIKELNRSDKKIFVLTNETDENLRESAYKNGIIDFIVKDKDFFYKINQISPTIEMLEKNKNKTILVVDDSKVIQEQLKDILSNRNYNVTTASNGDEAINIVREETIDLILLDIQLKDSNGIEFLEKHNKEIIDIKQIPVLIISGHIEYATIRNGLKAGAKDIIKKPYVVEEIVLKVDLWIDYKRKHDEAICSQKLLQEYKDAVDDTSLVSKTDINGIITYANKHFIELSGFKESELVGKSHNIVRHPDSKKEVFQDLWHTIKDEKKPWSGKIKNISKSGDTYWVNAYIKPIIDVNDNIVEFIGIRNDITELESAKKKIEEINKKTSSFIRYASLIQHAMIPKDEQFTNCFKEHFTIWEPKDIVGGDIYLFEDLRDENESLFMLIDYTGHGVPGAFVTMLVKALERQIVSDITDNKDKIVSPSEILSFFNKQMKRVLNQNRNDSISNSGFDGAVVYYNKKEKQIKFSSAYLPFIYSDKNKKLKIIKGDRHSIGYKRSNEEYTFKEHTLELQEDMCIYLTSDGYIDQNGGEKGFPYGKKKFLKLLEENLDLPLKEQKNKLLNTLQEYQKDEERNDDITVIGIKV